MDEEKKLESCEKCDEYLAGWKRAQADYQNLRKEVEKEKAEYVKFANERLLHELLPAIDQFSLALRHVPETALLPEDQRKTWENWLMGVKAVGSLWEQAANSIGLERIATDSTFDPIQHDAVGEEESEKETGAIARVVSDGWKWHGKIIKPAKVILAK